MNWWFHLLLCRFSLAHEGHTCRRYVILEYFQEQKQKQRGWVLWCMCLGDHDMMDYQREMISFIKPAQIIPGYGEVKVQQRLLVASYSVLYTYMHVLSLLIRWHTYTVWPTQHFFLASKQLAQRIWGSCTEAIQHLLQACPQAETYGVGRHAVCTMWGGSEKVD